MSKWWALLALIVSLLMIVFGNPAGGRAWYERDSFSGQMLLYAAAFVFVLIAVGMFIFGEFID